MIIKVNKAGFQPVAKTVRFGYDDETYAELFGETEHILKFYPSKQSDEYLVCIDAVNRDQRIGSLLVLDMKKKGNQTLLKRALSFDYEMNESDYEIAFV